MDPRLLEPGRYEQGLHLGKRLLARPASRPTWVPGYWQEVEGGWQWVPGYWAAENQQEVTYVPPPPPSLEEGPSTPAPDENSTYVPGIWVYQESRFLWRPGFWLAYHPGWVWTPAHYCRTTYGHIFVEGFWDLPLADRGLLFCPVVFQPELIRRVDFAYVPRYVVEMDFLLTCLFVRPHYYHYYLGDFFDPSYARLGFTSWIDYRFNQFSLDPNFAYYRHLEGREWERGLAELYVARRENRIPRPPHTLVQQQQIVNNISINRTQNVTVNKVLNINTAQAVTAVAPLTKINNTQITHVLPRQARQTEPVRLARISPEQRTRTEQYVRELRKATNTRRQEEAHLLSQGGAPVRHTDRSRTVKLPVVESPNRPAQPRPTTGQPPVEKQPPRETRHPVEKQPPQENRSPVEKQPPHETRPPVDKQPPRETRPPVEKQPPREMRPPVEHRPPEHVAPRTPPPRPATPKHEERPIPNYEPPAAPRPPRQQAPPRREPPPQQKKDDRPKDKG
jgi:hypothetical protein